MSTYNGDKYLREQIDSLLCQEKVDIDIIIRDDGSTDKTQDILDEYQSKKKLTWYTGRNLKPAQSFMDLVYNAPDSEYYAFCDQDDFWLPDKLAIAVEKLDSFPSDKPALYYGRPRLVDSELNMIEQSKSALDKMLSFESSVINSNATGCTMVFNKTLIQKVRMARPEYVAMHDAWFHKVCLIFGGNLYFDEDVHILYRQHGGNAIGISTSKSTKLKKHTNSLKTKECSRSRILISLYECYCEEMNKEQLDICKNVLGYKKSFKKKMRLIFNKRIRTGYLKRDLYYRIAVFLNAF